jgi:hypothetical protein
MAGKHYSCPPILRGEEFIPASPQGDLELLQHPISQELLQSKIPARLAYIGTDGTPRVVPIWFQWNGQDLVMGTPPPAPKLRALAKNPKVALTIDGTAFPPQGAAGARDGTPGCG